MTGAAFKLLQSRSEELFGTRGNGVKAFFGQGLGENKRGVWITAPFRKSQNEDQVAIPPSIQNILRHAREVGMVSAEIRVIADGHGHVSDHMTGQVSFLAESLFTSVVHCPEEPTLG